MAGKGLSSSSTLRASQRAVVPGQNALSTLLTEQAERVFDLLKPPPWAAGQEPCQGLASWRGSFVLDAAPHCTAEFTDEHPMLGI
jgi:hypothetical protein